MTDILSSSAGAIEDSNERYIKVLQYYLAGWHIKPKGVCVNVILVQSKANLHADF